MRADPTYYCAQPVWRRGPDLEPGRERFLDSAREARAAARHLARSAAAAVAYAFDGQPHYGVRSEPRVLGVFGELTDLERERLGLMAKPARTEFCPRIRAA